MFSSGRNVLRLVRPFSAFAPEAIFSEEVVKSTVAKFARMQPVKQLNKLPTKNAAVLIPLCVVDGQVSLLYTLRAAHLKSHRGQVSFPGGMEDAGDRDAEQTAIRETQEELGIRPELIEIWGKGNVIVSTGVTNVLPVIGSIKLRDFRKDIRMNPNEVKEVFTVPLQVLCDPKFVRHTQFKTHRSTPVYLGGKRKIWGLTAFMTHMFLKALLPSDVYNVNISYIPPLKAALPYRLL